MKQVSLPKPVTIQPKPLRSLCWLSAKRTVPAGVASCYQRWDWMLFYTGGHPFYVDEEGAEGSTVVDVDGNRLIDFHQGFGVSLFGYKHPMIVENATNIFKNSGFFVSVPTIALIQSSELLKAHFKMPFWRFTNSGTEATLDAIRMSRAKLGRDYIIKVESGYHGHHDSVWISIHAGERADGTEIPSTPFVSGIPSCLSELTLVVDFNNIESIQKLITKFPDQIGCIIVEPVLLNCSMIKPRDGYLQKVINLCRPHGIVVIFDIVKLNTAVSYQNISQFWDESDGPDMFTLGKGLSGGACPIGGD